MKYSLNLKACIFACVSIVFVGGSWQVMQAMNENKETTEDKNSDEKNCEIKNLLINKTLQPFIDAWNKKDDKLIKQEFTNLTTNIKKLDDCPEQTFLAHNPFPNIMFVLIAQAFQQKNLAFLYLLDQQEFLKAISIDNIIVSGLVIVGMSLVKEWLLDRKSIITYLETNNINIKKLENRVFFESFAAVISCCLGKPDISDSSHPNKLDSDSDSDDGEPFDESEIKDFNKLFIDDKDQK